jgi:hypothetical protein
VLQLYKNNNFKVFGKDSKVWEGVVIEFPKYLKYKSYGIYNFLKITFNNKKGIKCSLSWNFGIDYL